MPKRPTAPKSKSAQAGGAAKPATRTAVQGAIGVTVLIQGWNLFAPHPLTSEQTAWATVAITALVSFAMNLLEENGMPALLKGAPATAPTDDLTRRELNALAAALGEQRQTLERLGQAVLNLRADTGSVPHDVPSGLHTTGFQVPVEAPFRG